MKTAALITLLCSVLLLISAVSAHVDLPKVVVPVAPVRISDAKATYHKAKKMTKISSVFKKRACRARKVSKALKKKSKKASKIAKRAYRIANAVDRKLLCKGKGHAKFIAVKAFRDRKVARKMLKRAHKLRKISKKFKKLSKKLNRRSKKARRSARRSAGKMKGMSFRIFEYAKKVQLESKKLSEEAARREREAKECEAKDFNNAKRLRFEAYEIRKLSETLEVKARRGFDLSKSLRHRANKINKGLNKTHRHC
ncbi:gamma-tubulin complex component 6 [Acrasis kona]|uniref:Gamma-tubulin complex component 6 n=1 Tax=Acrasis kona TaxID=1008807 RepID=A0AAW2Z8W3_9EUKA